MYERLSVSVAAVVAVSWFLVVQSVFASTYVGSEDQSMQSICYSEQSNTIGACPSGGAFKHWNYGQASPPDGNDFVAIATGCMYSLPLKYDGSIVGWGNNNHGQASPPDGNDFVAIAVGFVHSLALKSDGTIVGWGAGTDD